MYLTGMVVNRNEQYHPLKIPLKDLIKKVPQYLGPYHYRENDTKKGAEQMGIVVDTIGHSFALVIGIQDI